MALKLNLRHLFYKFYKLLTSVVLKTTPIAPSLTNQTNAKNIVEARGQSFLPPTPWMDAHSPNTNNVNTHIKQWIPKDTQHTQLPTKASLKWCSNIPIGLPGPLVRKMGWMLGRHNGGGTRRLVQVLVCNSPHPPPLSLSLPELCA